MLNQTTGNKVYQKDYANGYSKDVNESSNSLKIEHMYSRPMYVPYMSITYYTAVIVLLTIFIIFILILGYINERPVGYITQYKGNCLLKLSSTYSAIECL